jgi:hypothetical protein
MLVGHVTVEVIDDEGVPTLRVEYLLDVDIYEEEDVDCITGDFLEFEEIHLHVATSPDDIPVNKKGNPEIGHFMSNDNPTEIALTDIPGYEPGPDPPATTVLYIAAHAVVYNWSEWCDICDELVIENVEELSIAYTEDGGVSYFSITIGDETYPVWCVDYDHSMSLHIGPDAYPIDLEDVKFYFATCVPGFIDQFPIELGSGYGVLGGIDRPENLPAVVWILNQYRLRTSPLTDDWTVPNVQQAVWYLMEDIGDITLNPAQQAIVDAVPEILPEPGCCDYVGVIIAPSLPLPDPLDLGTGPAPYGPGRPHPALDDQVRQLAIMLVPAPCCMDETAWALDPVTGTLFVPAGPSGKRSGSWAERFEFTIPY